ncbi:hypothetical protein [Paenibacillus harenae]|uniref:DUF3892 domain-containing protein n=1 Tax=Paenibacillus harenae TaxID=306543 RepID=A0ABT9U3T2_PAEHA|nr:hypothetical protein [Paenibacillus harenae]MDQ0114306.1 hypothetical protein [Paenibacillus harenae]
MKISVNVNFTKNNTNKKDETELGFFVRGNLSDEQIVKLARLKQAGEVIIDIRTSQYEIDDYDREEPRQGVRGTIAQDGTISVDSNQVTIDEVAVHEGGEGTAESDEQEGEEQGHAADDQNEGSEAESEQEDADSNPMHEQDRSDTEDELE